MSCRKARVERVTVGEAGARAIVSWRNGAAEKSRGNETVAVGMRLIVERGERAQVQSVIFGPKGPRVDLEAEGAQAHSRRVDGTDTGGEMRNLNYRCLLNPLFLGRSMPAAFGRPIIISGSIAVFDG